MHYSGANSYLFINNTKIIKFKVKDSEISAYPLCLGNSSKDWSVDNMKNTGLKGYVYDFSVDYNAIAVADILDIHKYLTKNEIVSKIQELNICSKNDVFWLWFIELVSIRMRFNEKLIMQSKALNC